MSPDTFLEPLYRWLYSVADWLLESSTMNGWVRFFEGLRMVEGLLLVALLALGFGLGAVFVIGCYATELGRQARFLGRRERLSNARLTCGSRLPGMVGMADAVNAEIDAADAERVEALHAADEFSRGLSALSHDVRTPLTGARGYLQLAREEADPARKDEQLAAADARLAAMSGLLDELFSYARAADPDTPLELGPVALRPVLEQVLLGHYPEFEARDWVPALDMVDSSIQVTADREALTRIVENLVVNALRPTPQPSMPTASSSASTRPTPPARLRARALVSPLPPSSLPLRAWTSLPASREPSLSLRLLRLPSEVIRRDSPFVSSRRGIS